MIQVAINELQAYAIECGAPRYSSISVDFAANTEPRVYLAFMPDGMRFYSGDCALDAIQKARQAVTDQPSETQRQKMSIRRKMAELLEEVRASNLPPDFVEEMSNPLMAMMDKLSTNILAPPIVDPLGLEF